MSSHNGDGPGEVSNSRARLVLLAGALARDYRSPPSGPIDWLPAAGYQREVPAEQNAGDNNHNCYLSGAAPRASINLRGRERERARWDCVGRVAGADGLQLISILFACCARNLALTKTNGRRQKLVASNLLPLVDAQFVVCAVRRLLSPIRRRLFYVPLSGVWRRRRAGDNL